MPFSEEKSKWKIPGGGIRLCPGMVSGLLFFAGFWVFFGSLKAAVVLRKLLWPWVISRVVLLSDFGGKTVALPLS